MWDTAVDFVIAKIGTILPLLFGLLMGYLAAATKWLNVYGPIAWGVAFLLGFLVFGAGWWVVAIAQRVIAQTRFARRREETAAINPLDDHFTRRRINLFDFFHPYYQSIKAAKFLDCELYGPAVIYPMAGTFLNTNFNGCEAVIVKLHTSVIGATGFENCTFERCTFYRVTFLFTKENYLQMKQQLSGKPVPVISDGTVGDL